MRHSLQGSIRVALDPKSQPTTPAKYQHSFALHRRVQSPVLDVGRSRVQPPLFCLSICITASKVQVSDPRLQLTEPKIKGRWKIQSLLNDRCSQGAREEMTPFSEPRQQLITLCYDRRKQGWGQSQARCPQEQTRLPMTPDDSLSLPGLL